MNIPWQSLKPEILRSVIEEFILREGTDYGARETAYETKIEAVQTLLKTGRAHLVFDLETESCDIREVP